MNFNFGLVYIATGEKYLLEATRSATSAKKMMPDIPISLWTDKLEGSDTHCFNFVSILKNPQYSHIDKIRPLLESRYEKTLFIDTDTYFVGSVYEISELLDNFELAYAQAPLRISPGENNIIEDVPICFPEANTGVIAYRKSEPVIQLINEWARIFTAQLESKNPPDHDQPAFRKALYSSRVRSAVLTPEYNFRTIIPAFKGTGRVKILHGREPSLSRAVANVNNSENITIFDFTLNS